MDPRYFAHTLTLYEARLFVAGLQRRRQESWEMARYQAFHSVAPHCKDFSFEKMPKFSWELETEGVTEMSEEEKIKELEALRRYALNRDKQLLENGIR